MIEVYEELVFRIASIEIDLLESGVSQSNEISVCFQKLASLNDEIEKHRVETCESIHRAIPSCDAATQKLLINIKRDLYNNRKGKRDGLSRVPSELLDSFEKIQLYEHKEKELLAEIKELLVRRNVSDQHIIRELCLRESFRKGLLLSSVPLFNYAMSLCDGTGEFDKKLFVGLWKYGTRVLTKATPFSTFTDIVIAKCSANAQKSVEVRSGASPQFSYTIYNNYLCDAILSHAKNQRSIFNLLDISLNPTIRRSNDVYDYFINVDNVEAFQTIETNEIINSIVEIMSGVDVTIQVHQLVGSLRVKIGESVPANDICTYVYQLVQIGFLEISFGISNFNSQWDRYMLKLFTEHIDKIEEGEYLTSLINSLVTAKAEFNDQPSSIRSETHSKIKKVIAEVFAYFRRIHDLDTENSLINYSKGSGNEAHFQHLSLDTAGVLINRRLDYVNNIEKNILYEDSTRDVGIAVSNDISRKIASSLALLTDSFKVLCYSSKNRKQYFSFFQENFQSVREVHILDFCRELHAIPQKDDNPEQSQSEDKNRKYMELRTFILDNVGQLIEYSSDVCNISSDFAKQFSLKFTSKAQSKRDSDNSAFVQLVFNSENFTIDKCVLNAILPGRGKMFSRFLHLFPAGSTESLQKWNQSLICEGEIHAENSDGSVFNANYHPCLLPFEITLPGGARREEGRKLGINDLFVRANIECKELELYTNDNKRVFVHDLGFQSEMGRSELFRFLSSFGDNQPCRVGNINGLFSSIFSRVVNTNYGNVVIIPRLVFNNFVVIQRKAWQVPISILLSILKKNADVDDYTHLISFCRWQNDIGIPNRVFYRLFCWKSEDEKLKRGDLYKPQYLDFSSLACLQTLRKATSNIKDGYISFEEILPDYNQNIEIDGKHYASEAIIQWKSCKRVHVD